MRGLLLITLALLLTPSLSAQMRGGMRGGGFSNRGSFHGPGHRGGFRPGFRGSFFSPRFRHRFFYPSQPWGYGYSSYYGYPAYYGSYDTDYSYRPDPYAASADQMANSLNERDRELQQQLDALRQDVARLTGAVQSRPPALSAAPARPPAPQASATPTILVFRDGTRQEVENYAIVGQTVWLFNEYRSHKVSLSALDMDATSKANDERGLSFQTPR